MWNKSLPNHQDDQDNEDDLALDRLLQSDLLQVPDNFSQRVMSAVYQQPALTKRATLWDKVQWLTVVGTGLLGTVQLAGFIFGIWAAGSAA
ncbi:MAG: hypothetical protein V4805_10515 [Pseudomonadota bacterium]